MSDEQHAPRPLNETHAAHLNRVTGKGLRNYVYQLSWPFWLAVGLALMALTVIIVGLMILLPSMGLVETYSEGIRQNVPP